MKVLVLAEPGRCVLEERPKKELDLISTRAGGFPDRYFPIEKSTGGRNRGLVYRLLSEGRVRVRPIVSHVLPVTEYAEALRLELEKPEGSLKVLVRWSGV